ncbi:hypothetical protein C8F01DRAFT_1083251 [Mycena amicta]|nr:hypothetical protein C8F01DRAFT_1083251 [Mycena amicta]
MTWFPQSAFHLEFPTNASSKPEHRGAAAEVLPKFRELADERQGVSLLPGIRYYLLIVSFMGSVFTGLVSRESSQRGPPEFGRPILSRILRAVDSPAAFEFYGGDQDISDISPSGSQDTSPIDAGLWNEYPDVGFTFTLLAQLPPRQEFG